MGITPLRALLFVAAAVVAALGTAYFAGAFDIYFGGAANDVAALTADSAAGKDDRIPAKTQKQSDEKAPVEGASGGNAATGGSTDGASREGSEEEVVAPTFDVVRVEPDGSLVVAGSAAPKSDVEIVSGATIVGKTKSGPAGDFAVVLDEPLEPGDYQLVLRTTSPDHVVATSKETAVVSVPDTPEGQVLALVEEPGEPSRLITVPKPTEPSKEVGAAEAEASAEKATGMGGQQAGVAETDGEGAADAAAERESGTPSAEGAAAAEGANGTGAEPPGDEQAVAGAESGQSDEQVPVADTSDEQAGGHIASNEFGSGRPERKEGAPETPVAGQGAGTASAADEPERLTSKKSEGAAAPREEAGRTAGAGEQPSGRTAGGEGPGDEAPARASKADEPAEIAAADPDTQGQAPSAGAAADESDASEPTVFIEAVEIDGDKVFVAGVSSEQGGQVRVYANEILLGLAEISPGGRFLVEATRELPVGDYIVRADLLADNGVDVIARAAVPFEREAGSKLAAVAPQRPASAMKDEPAAKESAPASTQEKAATKTASQPVEQAVRREGGAAGRKMSADINHEEPTGGGAGQAGEKGKETSPASLASAREVADTPRQESSPPLEAAESTQAPASSGQSSKQAADDTLQGGPGHETAAAEAPLPEDRNTITAPKLEPVENAVIIRRGDTLWQISRRVYGRGIRYTNIYLANKDQIRDPHWIWPGQVFAVPEKTEEGVPADMSAIADQAVPLPEDHQ